MTNLNEKRKEQISALFDDEHSLESRHLGDELEHAASRYSLIGDVMRGEGKELIQIDIADQVALALEQEETYSQVPEAPSVTEQVAAVNQQSTVAISNWKKPFAQMAIAASVAAVAVIGVQSVPKDADIISPEPQLQNLETMPFGGTATPVSYSTEPALETAQKGLRELEEKRLGALLLEHQRQSRIAQAEKAKEDELENNQ
ncbi:MAG: sigma-E factor negative regulatory protein [Pseudoalteromonas spongiae]|jgi:sigma-E factor negative regulatory protein RseA|uniref:sigma-E factor negative regulatory protein n=1 Tax=Pseudoalteromonas spongiae TaxID=298657 RepID=UPI000C2D3D1C|nr:RseA family anti-sigma factor [Pseudoalteromonas spongiae]MEC8326109.1 RseA family anti-sigma factor [Pseudomonadota bacterium]TMO82656.1 metal ABC transporter ATP-binding protein [Pseudoalteromonas spongiae]